MTVVRMYYYLHNVNCTSSQVVAGVGHICASRSSRYTSLFSASCPTVLWSSLLSRLLSLAFSNTSCIAVSHGHYHASRISLLASHLCLSSCHTLLSLLFHIRHACHILEYATFRLSNLPRLSTETRCWGDGMSPFFSGDRYLHGVPVGVLSTGLTLYFAVWLVVKWRQV